jgi:hypothetical protein
MGVLPWLPSLLFLSDSCFLGSRPCCPMLCTNADKNDFIVGTAKHNVCNDLPKDACALAGVKRQIVARGSNKRCRVQQEHLAAMSICFRGWLGTR